MPTITLPPSQASWNPAALSPPSNTGQQTAASARTTNILGNNWIAQPLPLIAGLLQQIMQHQQNPTEIRTPAPAANLPTIEERYDQRFRDNMVKTAGSLGEGWTFTEDLVQIKGGKLPQAETRPYTAINGQQATETVLERNNYWEVVQRGSNRYLLMRATDNSGQAVKPSDAINDVFNNRQHYAFDCASPMRLLNLKATLDTIGADDFDNKAGRLQISSWYDQHDSSGFDGGFTTKVRTAQAGEITVNGVSNLQGETALFDPNKGDTLTPGGAYYFDLPGDKQSASQGWNAVYLGRNDDGSYHFWSSSVGNVNVTFGDNNWLPQGNFKGYYLGAVNVNPNIARLQNWDTNRSV